MLEHISSIMEKTYFTEKKYKKTNKWNAVCALLKKGFE